MPSPPIRFDVSAIVELALAQSAVMEKCQLCPECLEVLRRTVTYALTGGLEAFNFELVKLKEGTDG